MILHNRFYTINSSSENENEFNATITIDPKHAIFEGHFPSNPVTPGVAQLEIIKELVSIHFNKKAELISMASCKFLAILNPEETPTIDVKLTYKLEDGLCKVTAQLESVGTVFTKLSAVYELTMDNEQ